MMDFDLLVKIGWTALLGWNLKETVSNGKDIIRLRTKIENGLTTGLAELKDQIKAHIDGEEQRILRAVAEKRRPRDREEADDA
jgi:hypothetical protein